jgi:para-nitrobenzyl esterase
MNTRWMYRILLPAVFACLAACGGASGTHEPSGTQGTASEAVSSAANETPSSSGETADGTVVEVTGGKLGGSIVDGTFQFLGVPYAEAKEFFRPAEAVTPWEGVRDATAYGKISYQSGNMGSSLTEAGENESNNCQNLNIWTPGTDGKKRPVMVWLHGGGFSTGSANEDGYVGANLAKTQDVVVVGVNHRLGVYGFLNLSRFDDRYKESANVGMLDIVDALQWIRDNIASFGGDPSNVTIFGQSGGGAKVLALMGSPKASSLFERGIMESGATDTMGAVFTSEEVSEMIGEETLENLNISADNVDAIQNVSYGDLQQAADKARAEAAEKYQIPAMFGGYEYLWEPVIDGDFLPEEPVQENGMSDTMRDYPLLIGSNLNEWNIYMKDALQHEANVALTEAYTKAYPNEDPAGAIDVDMLLRMPILKITAHKADQSVNDGGAPVYSYVFTKQDSDQGVYHGAEIPYVFDLNAPDEKLASTVSSLWASFARDGVPGADGVPTWEPYTREGGAVMIIDDDTYLAHHHDEDLIRLLKPDYSW